MKFKYLFRRSPFSAAFLIFCLSNCWAWEPTRADLEEAFLLWATPRAEYSGKPQQDAYDLLMEDSPAAARALPKFLNTPSGSIRDKILTICENMGAQVVGPAFRPHAGSDSPQLGIVMYCLSRSHDTESLPILLRNLKHPRWQMRSTAALSLGYLGDRSGMPDILAALKTETYPLARKSLAFAVGQCCDSAGVTPEILDALIGALDDPHFAVRFNAARALSGLDVPAYRQLQTRYDDLSDTGRYGALYVLGRTQNLFGRPILEKIAADTGTALRLRAVALKGLLDQKWAPADTALEDLRATPVGRGLFGLLR